MRRFLRASVPRLEERDVPVTLPAAWLGTRSRLRVNLRATSGPPVRLERFPVDGRARARFDWRLAVGDDVLTDEELAELAAAKEPLRPDRRTAGTPCTAPTSNAPCASWSAANEATASSTSCGPSPGSRPTRQASSSALSRSMLRWPTCSRVASAASLAPDSGGDAVRPVPVPGARSRLAPATRRSRSRRDPGRRDGPGQAAAGDRAARLRARGRRRLGPPLVVSPDERRQAMGGRARAVRAVAPRPSPPRQPPSFRPPRSPTRRARPDVVVTSYDIAARDADDLAAVSWDRALLDEAQDVKNPATKRARGAAAAARAAQGSR